MRRTAARPSFGLVGYGRFGRFVERTLGPYASCSVYSRSRPEGLERVVREPVVVLCVPVEELDGVLRLLAPRLPSSALVVDVSSVKVKPGRLVRRRLPGNPFLSLHPLFGPESAKEGVRGLPVVVCEEPESDRRAACVLRLLRSELGCVLHRMTPEEHDRQMAWVQGLSHFLSAGLREVGLPELPLRTRSFEHLLEMHRILGRTTEGLLRTICRDNPYAAGVRRRFLAALGRVERRLGRRGG